MAKRTRGYWAPSSRASSPTEDEKEKIIKACEALIADFFKPQFLPNIEPTRWNYVIDIHGAWAGGRYRFMQRYRSGMEHNNGEEFDAPFARLDRIGPNKFDICWMRHTGQWQRLYTGETLAEAIHILKSDGILHPH